MTLVLRSRHRTLANPSLTHLFSTSSSNPSDPSDPNDPSDPQSPSSTLSSHFGDVKASLKQPPPNHQQQPPLRRPIPPNPSLSRNSKVSFEEIRKNLSEFRRRSSVPGPKEQSSVPPQAPGSPPHISFEEIYKKNVLGKGENANSNGQLPFNAIRESLKNIRSYQNVQNDRKVDPFKLSDSLKLKPNSNVAGGTETLPVSIFRKDVLNPRNEDQGSNAMKTEFVKMYNHVELGEKLRKLRPEDAKGESRFSLGELNERLMKLREMEENETHAAVNGITFRDLRESLVKMKNSDATKTSIQRLDILSHLGRTPNFMLQPPKEELVEKYFHPDNMSLAEKLKLELAKVRDEFKMSESDCGSARVQVAQLTTKIKHLSSVLHKKDKHSLKGLQAMVQRRKKLLKYLRRTDWDSYCLVLSKLGLRDKPEFFSKHSLRYKTDN